METNKTILITMLISNDNDDSNHTDDNDRNNDNYHTGRHFAHIIEASVGQQFALGMSDTYSNPQTHLFYLWFSAYMIG